jgi:hypothetical protein
MRKRITCSIFQKEVKVEISRNTHSELSKKLGIASPRKVIFGRKKLFKEIYSVQI